MYVQETGNVYFTDDAVAFPLRRGYSNLINPVTHGGEQTQPINDDFQK